MEMSFAKAEYERLLQDIIQAGVKTKVMLLSATPVNNNLKDLRNQIYFVTEGRDTEFSENFGIHSLKGTLAAAQRTFTEWAKKSGEKESRELVDKLSASFFTLLDELTIARSRKHIQRYYRSSLEQIGQFPKRKKPISKFLDIDLKGRFLSYDRLNDEISNYQLSLFNPSKYVLEEYRSIYEEGKVLNFSQADREHFLIGMMKVNFLKRLESSVYSFHITMERTIEKIENLEERLREFIKNQTSEIEAVQHDLFSSREECEEDEELAEAFQVGGKLKIPMLHIDVSKWLIDLQQDKDQLCLLAGNANDVSPDRDAKLAELRKLIEDKVKQPTTNTQGEKNKKVVVFTAFADTANYLYDNLKEWARESLNVHIALVSGGAKPNLTTFGKAGI